MKKLILVSLLSLLFVPLFAHASLDTNLYYGLQKNSDVKQLQEFLIDKGFLTGGSTGNFFSLTLKAVKAYQASAGINSTGYVGNLTRAAINNELTTNLSASNQEAANETGTTPPTPTPPATTNDVVATLQAQIALLLQQVQAMQAQQTTTQQLQQTVQQQAQTIQQIQQNTQQIVQNTTPVCIPNWQCGNWSVCSNSTQTRTCTDSNGCGTFTGKPATTQSCTIACTPNWQTGAWNTCTSSQQTRTVVDSNNCGITTGQPSTTQSCIPTCQENSVKISVGPQTPISSTISVSQNPQYIFTTLKIVSTTGININKIIITKDGGTDDMFSSVSLGEMGVGNSLGSAVFNNGKAEFSDAGGIYNGNYLPFGNFKFSMVFAHEIAIKATFNPDKIVNGTNVRFGLSSINDIFVPDTCDNSTNAGVSMEGLWKNPATGLWENNPTELWGNYMTINQ